MSLKSSLISSSLLIDNLEDENNKVLLMTLHNAKGLEFNNVFLGGMEEGVFPGFGAMMSGDESEIEEERRLCYVGITRAKERLFLSAAKRRMLRGQTQYRAELEAEGTDESISRLEDIEELFIFQVINSCI